MKNKSVAIQTMDKTFYVRVEAILQGELSADLYRIIDCMTDRHGQVDSSEISFFFKH